MKQREIASLLDRYQSTISREVKIPSKRLRRFICKCLQTGYSPEITAFKTSEKTIIWKRNYETIYQWIYNDCQDLIPFLVRSQKKEKKRLHTAKMASHRKATVMVLANWKYRYVIFKKLDAKNAVCMHKAVVGSLKNFPRRFKNSITYDNGTENALYELTNKILGTKPYFCNSYHS